MNLWSLYSPSDSDHGSSNIKPEGNNFKIILITKNAFYEKTYVERNGSISSMCCIR